MINPGRNDEREVAPISDGTVLRRGDIIRIETGGGGGCGHPFDREPERVRRRRSRRVCRRGRAPARITAWC